MIYADTPLPLPPSLANANAAEVEAARADLYGNAAVRLKKAAGAAAGVAAAEPDYISVEEGRRASLASQQGAVLYEADSTTRPGGGGAQAEAGVAGAYPVPIVIDSDAPARVTSVDHAADEDLYAGAGVLNPRCLPVVPSRSTTGNVAPPGTPAPAHLAHREAGQAGPGPDPDPETTPDAGPDEPAYVSADESRRALQQQGGLGGAMYKVLEPAGSGSDSDPEATC